MAAQGQTGGFMPNLTGGAAAPSGASIGGTSTTNDWGGLTIVKGSPWVSVALAVVVAVLLFLLIRKKK